MWIDVRQIRDGMLCNDAALPGVRGVGEKKLADLGQPGPSQPAWVKLMAKRRRKTLVVCTTCHDAIHAENLTASLTA